MTWSPSTLGFWRSSPRVPCPISVPGSVLPGGTALCVTGLVSHAAPNPNLASVYDRIPAKGILGITLFLDVRRLGSRPGPIRSSRARISRPSFRALFKTVRCAGFDAPETGVPAAPGMLNARCSARNTFGDL
ncbi:hypothetical protein [Streptomyces sp. bgisy034]|uniref:hypothetical protein n=1 Tax=Streptomyces sp. bgisy034 TaxID=3413774 RepID=UPI003EB78476